MYCSHFSHTLVPLHDTWVSHAGTPPCSGDAPCTLARTFSRPNGRGKFQFPLPWPSPTCSHLPSCMHPYIHPHMFHVCVHVGHTYMPPRMCIHMHTHEMMFHHPHVHVCVYTWVPVPMLTCNTHVYMYPHVYMHMRSNIGL